MDLFGRRAGRLRAEVFAQGLDLQDLEGELAMVSMPGTSQEKFAFTVHDRHSPSRSTSRWVKRVAVHYEQKWNSHRLPRRTPYWVTRISVVPDIQFPAGALAPAPPAPASGADVVRAAQQLPDRSRPPRCRPCRPNAARAGQVQVRQFKKHCVAPSARRV